MGAELGCFAKPSIRPNKSLLKRFISHRQGGNEEKKSYSTQTIPTSDSSDEEENNLPDPYYFEQLTILLNKLPGYRRIPTAELITIVKRNPPYVPNIISLILLLENDKILLEKGMISMITQQGFYAKDIGDAIFSLKMHNIKIKIDILFEILANVSEAKTIANKIIKRKQKATMTLLFTQLQAEQEAMSAELDVLLTELQASEKEKIDSLVKELSNETPVFAYPQTPTSEQKPFATFYPENRNFECTFFYTPKTTPKTTPQSSQSNLHITPPSPSVKVNSSPPSKLSRSSN